MRIIGSLLLVTFTLFANVAAADEDKAPSSALSRSSFAEAGNVALSVEGALSPATRSSYETPPGSDLVVRPNVEVFVVRRLSLGIAAPLEWRVPTGSGSPRSYLAAAFPAVRVGYAVPLSRRVHFWPGARFGCSANGAGGSAARCESEALWTSLDARLAFELVPHVHAIATPLEMTWYPARDLDSGSLGPLHLTAKLGLAAMF